MPIRVYIDGAVLPPEEAKVSVFDRGFLYGDSVYETIGTAYGRLFAARDHLVRLERSAERIGLGRPPARRDRARDRRDRRRRGQPRVARAGDPDPRRRQAGPRPGARRATRAWSSSCFRSARRRPRCSKRGSRSRSFRSHRNSPRAIDPAVKSGNYLNNVLALGEARRRSRGLRGDPVRRRRQRRRGLDQQRVRGRGRRGPDAAARGRHPGRHHARQGHRALPRRRNSLRRAADVARRAARAPTRCSSPAPPAASCRSPRSTSAPVAGGRAGPGHAAPHGPLRRARAAGCRMNGAAGFLPKFYVICSVILILSGVAQVFVRPRRANETIVEKLVNRATITALLLGGLRRLRPAPRPRRRPDASLQTAASDLPYFSLGEIIT